jgi:hypothetical protein
LKLRADLLAVLIPHETQGCKSRAKHQSVALTMKFKGFRVFRPGPLAFLDRRAKKHPLCVTKNV